MYLSQFEVGWVNITNKVFFTTMMVLGSFVISRHVTWFGVERAAEQLRELPRYPVSSSKSSPAIIALYLGKLSEIICK